MTDVNANLPVDIHKLIDDWQPGPWDDLKMLLHYMVDHSYNPPANTETPTADFPSNNEKET